MDSKVSDKGVNEHNGKNWKNHVICWSQQFLCDWSMELMHELSLVLDGNYWHNSG